MIFLVLLPACHCLWSTNTKSQTKKIYLNGVFNKAKGIIVLFPFSSKLNLKAWNVAENKKTRCLGAAWVVYLVSNERGSFAPYSQLRVRNQGVQRFSSVVKYIYISDLSGAFDPSRPLCPCLTSTILFYFYFYTRKEMEDGTSTILINLHFFGPFALINDLLNYYLF
jgi:hypothetical protein